MVKANREVIDPSDNLKGILIVICALLFMVGGLSLWSIFTEIREQRERRHGYQEI